MPSIPTDWLVLGGSMVVAVIVMGLMGLWWIRDEPMKSQKLSWHQVLANSFHISLIDDKSQHWTLDIFYNENITSPNYVIKGERKLYIQLPINTSFRDYIDLISHLEGVHDNFISLTSGIIEETKLKRLYFSKQDLSLYREFKRNLLLKVLVKR